jgi:hypothetical protein
MSAARCFAPRTAVRLVLLSLLLAAASWPQTAVWTYHDNNARTGANTTETQLTPADVNVQDFGLLLRARVDGDIFAQPLYLPNVHLPNGQTRNLVFVATENDSVYAFDAQGASDGQGAAPVWVDHFTDPSQGIVTQTSGEVHCNDLVPAIGITGTPVIDTSTSTLYVVAATMDNGQPVQRLHALDVATGAEKFGGPAEISATVAGDGVGSAGGRLSFDPLHENQRAGLLLSRGLVYVAWGSHCDYEPFHGWLMAFNAGDLHLESAYVSTPQAEGGGMWGGAPTADASGNIYVATGNLGISPSTGQMGESVLRMDASGGQLAAADFFSPWNASALSAINADLSSQGTVLLPASSGQPAGVVVAGDKAGDLYVLNPNHLGGYVAGSGPDGQIIQEMSGVSSGVLGTPAYWNGGLYLVGTGDKTTLGNPLQAFAVNDDQLGSAPVAEASVWFRFPVGVPVVSADGDHNGIVWLLEESAWASGGPEVLHAFDAQTLQELYNSGQDARRDQAGAAVKFGAPAIADGEVFVPASGELDIYGLLGGQFDFTAAAQAGTIALGQPATIRIQTTGYGADVTFACRAPSSGCSFSPAAVAPGESATLTVAASALSAGGNTITIAASQAGSSKTAAVSITAQGFSLRANPDAVAVMAGQTAQFQVSAAAEGGLTGAINLTCQVPGGATCKLSSSSINPGQSATVTLASLPAGTETVAEISGKSAVGATGSAQLTATAWDFTVMATHPTVVITRGADAAKFTLATAGMAGFTGAINLSCQAAPPLACSFVPAAVNAGDASTLTVSGMATSRANQLALTVSAVSNGDTHTVPLTIGFSDFSMSAADTSATIQPGQSATYTLTFAPQFGWTGNIAVTCAPAPPAGSCNVSPQVVSISGDSQTAMVQVVTTAPPSKSGRAPLLPPPPGAPPWGLWLGLMVFAGAAAASRRRWAQGLALAALALALAACGGNSPRLAPSTPPGTFQTTVTAISGPLAHTLGLTVVIK